jgi:predicted SprT family Zn-dependent metalloprotease
MTDMKQVVSWALEAFNANGLSYKELGEVEVKFSKAMKVRAGVAKLMLKTKEKQLILSIPLWERSTEAQRRHTVMHEACHLADFFIRGTSDHGPVWQQRMQACGLEPRKYHDIDLVGLSRFAAYCQCGKPHEVGSRVWRNLCTWRCTHCHTPLRKEPYPKETANVA